MFGTVALIGCRLSWSRGINESKPIDCPSLGIAFGQGSSGSRYNSFSPCCDGVSSDRGTSPAGGEIQRENYGKPQIRSVLYRPT